MYRIPGAVQLDPDGRAGEQVRTLSLSVCVRPCVCACVCVCSCLCVCECVCVGLAIRQIGRVGDACVVQQIEAKGAVDLRLRRPAQVLLHGLARGVNDLMTAFLREKQKKLME